MLYFSCLTAKAQYGGGSGGANDPYLIYTAEQMNEIGLHREDWDKHFKLMADIDLSSYTGTDFNIIGYYADWVYKPFTGVFDGNGKTISNFSYTSTGVDSAGLFAYVYGEETGNAEIKNLGLIDPNVDAGLIDPDVDTGMNRGVGSLVGSAINGTINNCYVQGGSVSGDENVGGLVGDNSGTFGSYEDVVTFGIIINCYSTSRVSGNENVGGLVGNNLGRFGAYVLGVGSVGTIINCYSTSNVSGDENIGGLVGQNGTVVADMEDSGGTIINCYSTGSVSGTTDVGGLVGDNWHTITDCYAAGGVSGNDYVGGLAGSNAGAISNCYSVGSVSGMTDAGGLVGSNANLEGDDGIAINSFWDTIASGLSTSAGGMGKTTAEMQMPGTFLDAGWDFVGQPDGPHDIWIGPVGGGYPILWQQLSPLPELPSFSGGAGESNDPYLISTGEDLNSIGHNLRLMTAHFRLVNDIDLAGVDFFIIGNELLPFAGVFDGNGHAISNFTYDSNDKYYTGFFGSVRGENALVKDLGLIDPNVEAGTAWGVGSLVGYVGTATIADCYIEGGSVSGARSVGGLAGASYGTITNCYTTCSVLCSGDEFLWSGVGGLVGGIYYGGTISNCYSTGSVSGIAWDVGGLVGTNWDGTITNCYALGSVSGDWTAGGLVGDNWDTIVNCYSTGSVLGATNIGGLVGDNALGTIADCYATGSVSGFDLVGGLVGNNADWFGDEGTVTHCYSVGAVSGDWDIGGLVGSIADWRGDEGTVTHCFWNTQTSGLPNSAGGTGKTTAEMQIAGTFLDAGWDFVGKPDGPSDLWAEPASGGYPILWWQLSTLPELPSFSGGAGETNDPYLISTGEDLNSIGHNPRLMASHFKLINDIDLAGIDFYIMGSEWLPFTGVFDGDGKKIYNFTYTSTDRDHVGLFRYVDDPNAEIKDLGLIAPNVDAGTGNSVGSLVGYLGHEAITGCYAEGGSVSGDENVGGLVGHNYGGVIATCYATNSVSGTMFVGGLVGDNWDAITDCYAAGGVSGNDYVGGLAGNTVGTISNCYSVGSVSGMTDVGGLVNVDDPWWLGEVMFSFWDIQTSGQTTSAGGTGKTTVEMQTANTFLEAGWDFVGEAANGTEDIWSILEGQDYPRLWWEE